MKTTKLLLAGLLPALLLLPACDNRQDLKPDEPADGLFSMSDVAKILSELPLENEHLDEVYDAVSSSTGHGYDEEYRLTDLFEAPGAGVGDNGKPTKANASKVIFGIQGGRRASGACPRSFHHASWLVRASRLKPRCY